MAGELLGQYEYDEDKGCYVQSSTDQSNVEYIARYLYRDDEDEWVVGHAPGGKSFWLWNPNPSKKFPADEDWLYAYDYSWQNDPSLTVTPGPLLPLPSQFTVTRTQVLKLRMRHCHHTWACITRQRGGGQGDPSMSTPRGGSCIMPSWSGQ